MTYFEKVKAMLTELGHPIVKEDAENGLLLVSDEERGICNLVADCEGDILVLEQHIFDLDSNKADAYKRLLQINRSLVHGAFALDETGKRVLFRDTLELVNLDANELEAAINSLSLAMAEYGDELIGMVQLVKEPA